MARMTWLSVKKTANPGISRFRKGAARFLLLLFCLFSFSSEVFAMDVWITSPWLSVVANFMGGVFINVKPLGQWAEDGGINKLSIKKVPAGSHFIALDYDEALKYGIQSSQKNLFVLYTHLPFSYEEADTYFTDPSVLPFIAQRIMNIFSSLDHEHYFFYQRRLAEFQGRLESTVLLGRQLLKGKKVFNLSKGFVEFLRAAQCEILHPEDELWKEWAKGDSLDGLKQKIEECRKNNVPVLFDMKSPVSIHKVLLESKSLGVVLLEYPDIGQDIILSLYDQYLAIWNAASSGGS